MKVLGRTAHHKAKKAAADSKHADATEVFISLSQTPANTILTIKDNGRGFDLSAKRDGIGLNNIFSRAKVFDGEVTLESAAGQGCLLTVSLPAAARQHGIENAV